MHQVDLPNSNIRLIFKGEVINVIGAQVHVYRDNDGGAIKVNLIDDRSMLAGIYGITGSILDMTQLIRGLSEAIPRTSIDGEGKYVNVASIGNDICLTLTEKGRSEIESNGYIDYLFDDMKNGTRLQFNLETVHPRIIGPSVTTFISPYETTTVAKSVDDRIWHYPKCAKEGVKAFWDDFLGNNWIILRKGKINRRK